MKYYAGLDVSMKTTSICIVNQEKKIVFESEVDTDPNTIFSTIRGTGLDIENSAVESGSISHWLVHELSKKKMPIICVDARKMSRVAHYDPRSRDNYSVYI